MMICEWEDLPENMRTDEVRPYYDILCKHKFQLIIKRIVDIVISLTIIMLMWPIFIAIAIAIKIDSPGPVFYRQFRVGQYGKLFKIFKFRSMVNNADKNGSLVTVQGDMRITKVGKFIRKYRLDETSQLFDVLRGTMTLVGTRPEVQKYVEQYNKTMLATLLLPPGVTSLASITYRNENDLIDKKHPDDDYINKVLPLKMKCNLIELSNIGFVHDMGIMIRTVFNVVCK